MADKYEALTGICNSFASISKVLVYNRRLSKSSRSLSVAIVIGLYIDLSSWPMLRNSRHALVRVSACRKLTAIKLKHDRVHSVKTNDAFHVK